MQALTWICTMCTVLITNINFADNVICFNLTQVNNIRPSCLILLTIVEYVFRNDTVNVDNDLKDFSPSSLKEHTDFQKQLFQKWTTGIIWNKLRQICHHKITHVDNSNKESFTMTVYEDKVTIYNFVFLFIGMYWHRDFAPRYWRLILFLSSQ